MSKWRTSVSSDNYDADIIDYNVKYPGLPEELNPYIFGFLGIGPCVMAIMESNFDKALLDGPLEDWEIKVSCKLFSTLKYRFNGDHIIVTDPAFDDWSGYYELDLW